MLSSYGLTGEPSLNIRIPTERLQSLKRYQATIPSPGGVLGQALNCVAACAERVQVPKCGVSN